MPMSMSALSEYVGAVRDYVCLVVSAVPGRCSVHLALHRPVASAAGNHTRGSYKRFAGRTGDAWESTAVYLSDEVGLALEDSVGFGIV